MEHKQETHVVFGTGPLGLAVMRELARCGHCVRVVNRSGHAAVPAGVEVIAADAYDPARARAVCQGADVVYQCAQPAYTEWTEKFPPLQASILDGAAAAGARLVVGENLYLYGDVDGPLTEDLPNAATTRKGRVRAAMSETLMEAHHSGKLAVAIGRASDFFGPGVTASAVGERVFRPALAGKKVTALGDLDAPHTYTFIDDFGRALVTLGEHEEAFGQAWHIPSAETVTTRRFITMVFEAAGREPKMGAAPKWLLRLVGLADANVREILEMTYEFEKPFVVDHAKFARAFGDQSTPNGAAIAQTLEWYRQHPAT